MVSRRFWSTVLLGLGAVLGAVPALAQVNTSTTIGTGTGALQASDFTFRLQRPDGSGDWEYLSAYDEGLYFNQARCLCTDDSAAVRIVVQIASAARTKLAALITAGGSGGYARLYVGTGCTTLNAYSQPTCDNPADPVNSPARLGVTNVLSQFSSTGSWAVDTTVGKIFAGKSCSASDSVTLWLWINTNTTGSAAPDLAGDSAPKKIIKLNGAPPPAPSSVVVEGGNEALMVSWAPSSTTDNPVNTLAGYMVFCARGEDLKVFSPSFYDDQYLTPSILCPAANISPITSSNPGSLKGDTTATEVTPPAGFKVFNPDYTCTDLVSPSSTSVRLKGLQNHIPYTVSVAAVDTSGNISAITSAFVQKPVPTVDFYRAYRDAGGDTEGGYCSLGGSKSPGILACLAGAGLVGLFFLRRRRRRHRRTGGRGLTVLLVLLAAGAAQAQPVAVTHEDGNSEDLSKTFEEPKQQQYRTPKNFAFELRFGAFRPDIDSEFSDPQVHPYKDVYGGKRHLMSQFELDWQLFQAFGSLSLAGVVGYYSQSAKANIAGTLTPSGDSTGLRLIPTAALLVYRFDVLALRYGIPLVPYAKMGLNYTFWRITDGNGDVAHYLGGRGSGGTLGWQAAAGISLMLDFIDPTAAHGLDIETGVNHTYAFFEWDKVEANGLGQSKKLHVGDSSWVVGLMFEF